MKNSNEINAYYIDEQGVKQKIKANEIFIDLPNGQTLTINQSQHPNAPEGLVISDHSNLKTHQNEDTQPNEYAVLDIKPSACNVIIVNSKSYKMDKV